MLTYHQFEPNSPEAGGVLIGRLIVDSLDVVLDSATPAMPHDQRSRFRIDRLDPAHQIQVNRAFENSGGTYVGEWHTHPEAHPQPSQLDLRNWRRKSREDLYYGAGLVFMILGTEYLGIWYIKRRSWQVMCLATAPYNLR